eukprot:CAMPEP_0170620466 /NCGR_PEP_ID=MMETSP0224-20130122/28073_1 /TAXON_ID=285029 /ORGANISM="Togula jolla, Strain CCCM 725" /LENGTH=558 /DNA_ID=CAMNT_0010946641 /DNA_START=105 /DNA_END=1781 /DNA_ORIENTATION=+
MGETHMSGYMAYSESSCTSAQKCPAVVIIHDWTGMDDYEMERARMLGNWGYVALAADIYGTGTPLESMADWGAAASAHRGNSTLYHEKIQAALDHVKTYDFVDSTKVAVVGYCFGGTGIVNLALLGADVAGVVGYHSGISPDSRVLYDPTTSPPVRAKVLLHSGVMDDDATEMEMLAQELESANATYEIIRYGKDVYHSFTEWNANSPGSSMYDQRADVRSWESTKHFLNEVLMTPSAPVRGPESASLTAMLKNYTAADGTLSEGYVAYDASMCNASSPCPVVVVVQDWTGMDSYEKERARMVASLGYVAIAADIYGFYTPKADMNDWRTAATAHRANLTMYMERIQAAIDEAKTYDFVDASKVAAMGYCFGGTGVLNMVLLGLDVAGVVGYHSGISPDSVAEYDGSSMEPITAKVLMHWGVDDNAATGVDVASLEQLLEGAGATYEFARYGSDVPHGYTVFDSPSYDERGDVRSWQSTASFLQEIFHGLPDASRNNDCPSPTVMGDNSTAATSMSPTSTGMGENSTSASPTTAETSGASALLPGLLTMVSVMLISTA